MTPVKLFHKYRGLRDFTMTSLLEAVRGLLPEMVKAQTRYKVTDLPTERTVRYYIAQGLIDGPYGKRGTSSLYGYRHLLQILTVKYLQSQYLPLRKIKSVLKGRSNRGLEQILPGSKLARLPTAAILSEKERDDLPERAPAPGGPRRRGNVPETGPGSAMAEQQDRWRRLVLAPGVELHVREDLSPFLEGERFTRWKEQMVHALVELQVEADVLKEKP
jgi:DNA-binding transcriptional MerR regulator